MPWFRCSDPDHECGHTWFEKSALDEEPECVECGEPAQQFDPNDDDAALQPAQETETQQPRSAFARELARKQLSDAGVTTPPVPVRELAETQGLTIALRQHLGSLRGRLVGSTIELVKADPVVVQRFTIAHELGHRALQHKHGDGDSAETEANEYANELLVPGPLLRAAMDTTTSAAALRGLFDVSKPVLDIACKHHRCADRLTA